MAWAWPLREASQHEKKFKHRPCSAANNPIESHPDHRSFGGFCDFLCRTNPNTGLLLSVSQSTINPPQAEVKAEPTFVLELLSRSPAALPFVAAELLEEMEGEMVS